VRVDRAATDLAMIMLALIGVVTTPHAALTNSSFESPRYTPTTADVNYVLDSTTGIGWKTTASDHIIEFWTDGGPGGNFTSFDQAQHVELNATEASTLYQDAVGIAQGASVGFTFAHRGRNGLDKMQLTIIDAGP